KKAMREVGIVEVRANNLAALIDSIGSGASPTREVDLLENALIQEIGMSYSLDVKERANNLTAIIDPASYIKGRAARKIDLGKDAIVEEKAMLCASCIDVGSHDLTTIIHIRNRGTLSLWDNNLGE